MSFSRIPRQLRRSLAFFGVALLIGTLAACSGPELGPIASPQQQSQAKARFDRAALLLTAEQIIGPTRAPELRLSSAEIDSLFAEPGFVVPEEPKLIWTAARPGALLPGGWLLLDALESREAYRELRARLPWRPNWLPMARRDAQWLAVECSRSSSPAGPVLLYDEAGPVRIVAANFTALFASLAGLEDSDPLRPEFSNRPR